MSKILSAYIFGSLSGCVIVGLAVFFSRSNGDIGIHSENTYVLKEGHGLPENHTADERLLGLEN